MLSLLEHGSRPRCEEPPTNRHHHSYQVSLSRRSPLPSSHGHRLLYFTYQTYSIQNHISVPVPPAFTIPVD